MEREISGVEGLSGDDAGRKDVTPGIADTMALIQMLHAGQVDWSGQPYWTHPVAVMESLPAGSPEPRKLVALLHDVVEDCGEAIAAIAKAKEASPDVSLSYLASKGYGRPIRQAVALLSRNMWPGSSYLDLVRAIVASGDIDAMVVKLADNMQNTAASRFETLPDDLKARATRMRPRYEASKTILRAGLRMLGQDVAWSYAEG